MGKALRVKVQVFGAPSFALESKELTIDLNENATAEDLLKIIPVKDRNYLYVVREGMRLSSSTKLNDGDEILIVPPIAGG